MKIILLTVIVISNSLCLLSQSNSDCVNSTPICSNANFQISPNNFGNINDIPTSGTFGNPNFSGAEIASSYASMAGVGNSGCLQSGELHSTWMLINILHAGTLEFTMGEFTIGANYYDWAMWPYSSSVCNDIRNGIIEPIRCNWNGTNISFTGMGNPTAAGLSLADYNSYAISNFAPALNAPNNSQYLICFSNYSSATSDLPLQFFGTANVSCYVLGQSDLEIIGHKEDRSNKIQWFVSNQNENNASYILQYRTDEHSWQNLDTIAVNHGGSGMQAYTYLHTQPQNGSNYYRIQQEFHNKNSLLSEIVQLDYNATQFEIINVYPNPTSDEFHVQLSIANQAAISISIVDLIGKEIYSEQINIQSGNSVQAINVSTLKQGKYLLMVKDNNSTEQQVKFVEIK